MINSLLVHKRIRADKILNGQERIDTLVSRNNFVDHKYKLKQKLACGNLTFITPYIKDDKIGITTGCEIKQNLSFREYIVTRTNL